MTYYRLNDSQKEYLHSVVPGLRVSDLGSGDGSLALLMANFGALEVHAVDKAPPPCPVKHKNVKHYNRYFQEWDPPNHLDLSVVSWPRNMRLAGLIPLLQATPQVIYLGKNTDGTACGFPDMFRYLSTRNVIRYLPDRANVMIHYGSDPRPDANLYHEEMAGIFEDNTHYYCADEDRKIVTDWGVRKPIIETYP